MSKQGTRQLWGWWIAAGITLIGLSAGVTFISSQLGYDSDNATSPIPLFVCLLISASVVHLLILSRIRYCVSSARLVAWIVFVGAILRVSAIVSEPILEDDFYRYLWDGGVLAHGFNPYIYVPESVANDAPGTPEALRRLAHESGNVIARINHPSLATCYPPVAELIFAGSHLIGPWSLTTWRVLLLAFDAVTLGLIFLTLRKLGRSPLWVTVYWWCPLLVKEGFNAAHMDIVLLPFVLGALWFGVHSIRLRDTLFSAGLLGVAVGIKLWPIVLVPLLFRSVVRRPAISVSAAALFGLVLSAQAWVLVPILRMQGDSGVLAYGQRWEMNDALFMGILRMVQFIPGASEHAGIIARAFVAGILVLVIVGTATTRSRTALDIYRRGLWITAAVFMLSPTQFPWYYLWVIPFLALAPQPSLLLMTALLPLYYFRFYFGATHNVALFDNGIVWLEFAPVWCLAAIELVLYLVRQQRRLDNSTACDTVPELP